MGRELAVVVMRPKPKPKRRRRRRRRKGSGDGGASNREGSPKQGGPKGGSGKAAARSGSQSGGNRNKPRGGGSSGGSGDRQPASSHQDKQREPEAVSNERPEQADIETQADVAKAFLEGLLEAFGLEAEVTTRIDGDILYMDVSGEQSEALVGPKGSVLDSVLELTRTVVQRKTFGAPRMRLDIAGYTERRREALRIYAAKLADKVKESGGEVMLEPMNPADRKVVHDAIAEIEGVRSFSEGEDQDRAVVVAPDA